MENQGLSPQERRALLLEKAKEAPLTPGVYLMKNQEGQIIYVGKAKALKNRVSSYFQPANHDSPRTELMVHQVDDFEFILTETESEALILECTLIKKHRPKYNVRLKDDKAYPYLKIQLADPFPRIEWTRKPTKDGARYFGPFPSAWSARQVLHLLNEELKLRDCSDNAFRHRSRACLLYQMGQCTAPCVGKISQEDYGQQIDTAVQVLEGRSSVIQDRLREQMIECAEAQEYEDAAHYRDQSQSLELVTSTQGMQEAGVDRNRDVLGLARKGTDAHVVLLEMRAGRMSAIRHYNLGNTDTDQTDHEILGEFIEQHYSVEEPEQQREVLVPFEFSPDECELWSEAIEIQVFIARDDHEKRLSSVAKLNAEHALEQALKRSSGHGIEALMQVQEKLGLPRLPTRIECYDISNIQGSDSVASRVVFIEGVPDKNLYRRYKIETVEGQNDFAMMKEVLGRRFSKEGEDLPDLVVVDGGKGQLAQAVTILEELGVQGVFVVGLAKARTESDFQSSEVKSSSERIFIPGRKNPIPLHSHMPAYKLLTHIRDEAHRFAVSYHRLVRKKRTLGE